MMNLDAVVIINLGAVVIINLSDVVAMNLGAVVMVLHQNLNVEINPRDSMS